MAPPSSQASIVTISYNDLCHFYKNNPNEQLVKAIGLAYGPDGLGILAVSDAPHFEEKRMSLLPLAAQLAALPNLEQLELPKALYSTGWSHGKEQVNALPDWSKGSFYANPVTEDLAGSLRERDGVDHSEQAQLYPEFYAPNVWPSNLKQLQPAFLEMGQLLASVGRLVAKVCDVSCARNGVELKLEETLTRSLNAKGRLLHYFDTKIVGGGLDLIANDDVDNNMWCGWHNDHGSLTGLVPGMYLDADQNPVTTAVDDTAGLYIQARSGEIVRVTIPSNQCAFQIGETSQIQSGGLLQATPHAVVKPSRPGITRESFALFLEPEFDDPLEIPPNKTLEDCQDTTIPLPAAVKPLKQRWQDGHTFGMFHRATVSAFTV